MRNEITFTIEEDGTITIETGSFSGTLHKSAEEFLEDVETLCDDQRKVMKQKSKHVHVHRHQHTGHGHKH